MFGKLNKALAEDIRTDAEVQMIAESTSIMSDNGVFKRYSHIEEGAISQEEITQFKESIDAIDLEDHDFVNGCTKKMLQSLK